MPKLEKRESVGIFVFIMMVVFLAVLPASLVREPINMSHHTATIHAFEYASVNHHQFGKEIIDNVGPYGYLHYPIFYSGGAFYSKILSFAAVCLFFAFFTSAFILKIPGTLPRGLSLILIILFSFQENFPLLSYEIIPRLTLLFSGLFFLSYNRQLKAGFFIPAQLLTAVFYAYLSLQKTSNCHLVIFIILILSIYFIIRKQWLYAAVMPFSFVLLILLLWVAKGQNAALLPHFYLASFYFSVAYQEALAVPSKCMEYVAGFISLTAAGIIVLIRLFYEFRRRKDLLLAEIFASAIFGACIFTAWKHGMIGTNIHTGIYFDYFPCILPYLFFYRTPWDPEKVLHKSINHAVFGAFIVMILLFFTFNKQFLRPEPWDFLSEFSQRMSTLTNYRPGQKKRQLDEKISVLTAKHAIPPELRAKIADSRVDEFGFEPAIILVNSLNYAPRPVAINFVAVSNKFKKLNQNCYVNDATAPKFVFAKIQGLQINDSGTFIELLQRYRPVGSFSDWLVLERSAQPNMIEISPICEKSIGFDEYVQVPDTGDSFLWCRIHIKYSLMGRLIKYFYKPTMLAVIYVTDRNESGEDKLSKLSGEYGFILNPLVVNNEMLKNLYENGVTNALRRVKKLKIVYRDSDVPAIYYNPEIKISFYRGVTMPGNGIGPGPGKGSRSASVPSKGK